LAVDWGVFADWVIVTLVISVVVGLSHSFFEKGVKGSPRRTTVLPGAWAGEFLRVTVPEADSMLLYAEEMLKRGDLEECVRVAYSAAEEILLQAASTLGIPGEHTTLTDLAGKLSEAGFVGLDAGELGALDSALGPQPFPLDRAGVTGALGAAFFLRNYFMHAPVAKEAGKKPIGADT
jgi:hypothetical protein